MYSPLLYNYHRYDWTLGTVDSLSSLYIVALPLVATWLGDASAYFVGTEWGRCRSRLAPEISPNKSWVGFWANLAGGSVAGVVWFFVSSERLPGLADAGFLLFAFIGGLLGFAAVLGDLLESVFKREAGVKDSGVLFPGHGGALDRIDSLFSLFRSLCPLGSIGGARFGHDTRVYWTIDGRTEVIRRHPEYYNVTILRLIGMLSCRQAASFAKEGGNLRSVSELLTANESTRWERE